MGLLSLLSFTFWLIKFSVIISVGFTLFVLKKLLLPPCVQKVIFPQSPVTPSSAGLPPLNAKGKKKRVAVIGGGIAGMSAAWTLARGGALPTVFEARPVLGGNAKTYVWEVPPTVGPDGVKSQPEVRTGLSVLAWPSKYFKHYEMLLSEFSIPTTTVRPKFLVSLNGVDCSFAHGDIRGCERWHKDMARWDRSISFIRKINNVFTGVQDPDDESMYCVNFLNPMNLIPAWLLCRCFGVSTDFWNCVVVPVYSSSFLSTQLNQLPAFILPVLDDIISVGSKHPVRPLTTWIEHSANVFHRMSQEVESAGGTIVLNADVTRVCPATGYKEKEGVIVSYAGGSMTDHFDAIIFACPATAVNSLTQDTKFRSPLFNEIICNITYENQRDVNFTSGAIHTNRRVLPPALREKLMVQEFSNYILVRGNPSEGMVENTFMLGNWIPATLSIPRAVPPTHDFYVTYNPGRSSPARDPSTYCGEVDNSWAHPQFTFFNFFLSFCMRLIQGQHNAYYCASYTTPGNGHDLSMLSGLIAASRALGNDYYPFSYRASMAAERDFKMLKQVMGI